MLAAGLMSGTSADGIDAALVEIFGLGWKTRLRLLAFRFTPYPPEVRERVLAVAGGAQACAAEISNLNFLLGELFADACVKLCRKAKVPLAKLKVIGSHGQTIFHQAQPVTMGGMAVRSTMQIGEPAIIAERTGVTTIADFRPADMAAGGQGAPLVPFFDYVVFRHPKKGRVLLNIGGIANLTAIPAGASADEVIAFDTGPGNMLMDALAARASGGVLSFDAGGKLASEGRVDEELLGRLLEQPFFHVPPPKSAGREQFGSQYLEEHFNTIFHSTDYNNNSNDKRFKDALATAAALTAESIVQAVIEFVLPKFRPDECFVSGGGVKNRFLMRELERRLLARAPGIRLLKTSKLGIPAEAKEAVAFAVLAYHSLHRLPSNLCSATGAKHPAILGKVCHGRL